MPLSGGDHEQQAGHKIQHTPLRTRPPYAGDQHRHRLLRPLPKVSDRGTGALERRGSAPSSAGARSQTQQWGLTA